MTFPKWDVAGWDWLQSSLALSWPAELGGGGADGLGVQCFLALGAVSQGGHRLAFLSGGEQECALLDGETGGHSGS